MRRNCFKLEHVQDLSVELTSGYYAIDKLLNWILLLPHNLDEKALNSKLKSLPSNLQKLLLYPMFGKTNLDRELAQTDCNDLPY